MRAYISELKYATGDSSSLFGLGRFWCVIDVSKRERIMVTFRNWNVRASYGYLARCPYGYITSLYTQACLPIHLSIFWNRSLYYAVKIRERHPLSVSYTRYMNYGPSMFEISNWNYIIMGSRLVYTMGEALGEVQPPP